MKNYVITLIISIMICASLCTILLMVMVPQDETSSIGTVDKYVQIYNKDYSYENTKNITDEKIVKQYTITSDMLATFKKKMQYVPGNINPFTSPEVVDIYAGNNSNNNTNDNTTNSNGGNQNSSNTGK